MPRFRKLFYTSIYLLSIGFISVFLSACSAPVVLGVFDFLDNTAGNMPVAKASYPNPLPAAQSAYALPEHYYFNDKEIATSWLLRKTGTASLLIVHKGEVVYENYDQHRDENSRFLAWSVSKSVTSALVGIAVHEGLINDIHEPVTNYVPSLATTAYVNSTIEDVLEMASGVQFTEVYFPGTDIFYLQLALGKSFTKELQKYDVADYETGTFNEYKSIDTIVLGMILQAATGESVTSYLESRIWEPAGMTNDAVWLADDDGLEGTYCCLKATARDLAKFGLIYLNQGFYNGKQIVPQQWVADSLDTSKPHLQPGADNTLSDWPWGYGYQWWIPDNEHNDFSAVGVYNQFIYVNPDADLVIVKTSGNPSYLSDDREDEHIALFRTISNDFVEP